MNVRTIVIRDTRGAVTSIVGSGFVGPQGNVGPTGPAGTAGPGVVTMTVPTTLAAGIGKIRYYFTAAAVITNIVASVGTAPTGAAIIANVNKNGTTLFTTLGNRPTIVIGAFTDLSSVPDVTTINPGDYLSIDVLQVGSLVAGANLVVQVYYS